ncbi:MAG TPA: carbon storage regulator CsrA [Gemmataceae bacterium]|nr:carbon storage regulator CsrA [Gemmataceae bacterium]
MLVVTRRVGEQVVIGDVIRVRIVAVHNGRVKVGIMAPQQMTVHRQEVYQRLKDFNDCPAGAEHDQNTPRSE